MQNRVLGVEKFVRANNVQPSNATTQLLVNKMFRGYPMHRSI